MDPVSIITAAASAAAALYAFTTAVEGFMSDTKDVNKTLDRLHQDVKSLLSILGAITNAMSDISVQESLAESPYGARIMNAALDSLHDCKETGASLGSLIKTINKSGRELKSFIAQSFLQLRLARKQSEIVRIQQRMQAHRANLQLSLQTINILIASSSSDSVVNQLRPQIDGLRASIEKNIVISDVASVPSKISFANASIIRHTKRLTESAINVLEEMGTAQANERSLLEDSFPDDYSESDADSEDEVENQLILKLLAEGGTLCGRKGFAAAEATLRNMLKMLQQTSLRDIDTESMQDGLLRLGIAVVYQEKWFTAEEVFSDILDLDSISSTEKIRHFEASFYMAQIFLARHHFERALEFCQRARKGQKKYLGKQHEACLRSLSLLVLIFETSADKASAAAFRKVLLASSSYIAESFPIVRFTCEGHWLSIDREAAALERLAEYSQTIDRFQRSKDRFLRHVAYEGWRDEVQLLLWQGAGVNEASDTGYSALTFAAQQGHAAVVDLLLRHGADVENAEGGKSPLYWAALFDQIAAIGILIVAGASVDGLEGSKDGSALEIASAKGHVETMRFLLDHGADVNHQNSDGSTPLMAAVKNSDGKTIQILLLAGAKLDVKDQTGKTAMEHATQFCRSSVLKVLEAASKKRMEP